MNKRGRGKRGGRGVVARIGPQPERREPQGQPGDAAAPPDCPVVLSITPDGITLPGRAPAEENPAAESARLRRELEQHARDVEEFVRAQRFNSLVTRVLSDLNRPDPGAPPMRLRK